MRILFSSDLHDMQSAFERFAATLRTGGYDAGVLGGDLINEYRLQDQAREVRIRELTSILESAATPILLIPGNHDRSPWPDTTHITNIHMRRVEVAGRPFAGYRWTTMDRSPRGRRADARELRRLVDRRTVLVSHSPAARVLDGTERGEPGDGCEELRRVGRRAWLHLVGHVHRSAGTHGHTVNGSWPHLRQFFSIHVDRRTVHMVA